MSIRLFCCYEKVFTHKGKGWLRKIDETSLSKKEDFYSHLNGRCYWCGLHEQKIVYKDFEYIYNEK